MNFLTITAATWYMAGISVAVVFSILILLVLVLWIFSMVASEVASHASHSHSASKVQKPLAAGVHADEAEDEHVAAVATAVYLYLNSAHDEESGVLTIDNSQSSGWHIVLNPRF